MEAVFSKKSFYLFKRVLVDQNNDRVFQPKEEVTADAFLALAFRGEEFRADLDDKTYQIRIEENGSQRAVIKASGWLQSSGGKRY